MGKFPVVVAFAASQYMIALGVRLQVIPNVQTVRLSRSTVVLVSVMTESLLCFVHLKLLSINQACLPLIDLSPYDQSSIASGKNR